MRFFVIIGLFVGAIVFMGFAFSRNLDKVKSGEAVSEPEAIEIAPASVDLSSVEVGDVTIDNPVPLSLPPSSGFKSGSYLFKNRVVPVFPSDFQIDDLVVSTDLSSNTWFWVAPKGLDFDIFAFARSYDHSLNDLDLDFVLIAISEDWLKSRGISALFAEGENFLSGLDLDFDRAGLTLSYKGLRVDVGASNSRSKVRVVTSPSVRCVVGRPWRFRTIQRIPFQVTSDTETSVRTSTEFIEAGLTLSGTVHALRDSFRLILNQENSSPVASVDGPPVIESQELTTALDLEWDRWSVAGGVRARRFERVRGIFGSRSLDAHDHIVVFVRPRNNVQASIPVAVPVSDDPLLYEHPYDEHLLLPPLPSK